MEEVIKLLIVNSFILIMTIKSPEAATDDKKLKIIQD